MNCPRPYCERELEEHPSGLGSICRIHGFISSLEMENPVNGWTPSDEDKADHAQVPEWDVITIGTESKGRLKVHIPVDATDQEAKRRIDRRLTWLWYAIDTTREMGLDILPARGKKEAKE